ncbi:MAG: hypothetical protein IPG02_06010 [Ignavibacteria bacterium]|nr:hypothetical protein [Ignavibacteria bacterium]
MIKKNKPNVLFIWEIDKELKAHLRKNLSQEVNLIFADKSFAEKKTKLYETADAIVGWRPEKELLFSAKKLKLFINPGTGIKHQIENFRELSKVRNVKLINGHGHSYATAQHAVAMLLALMNRIVQHHNWMESGIWRTSDDKDIFSASIMLKDRKIGLLGYGAINSKVHKFLSGFSNEFNILKRRLDNRTPHLTSDQAGNKVSLYGEKNLKDFLKDSDILIVAIPHTSKTEGLIGSRELKLLGKKGLLVNVARGTIVNEASLYNALSKGTIAGAALDVWYNYNPKKDKKGREYPFSNPFHKLSNVVLSPHRAASPFDDLGRWDEVIENLKRLASGKRTFLNVVDLKEEY